MSDFDDVLERLLTEPAFAAAPDADGRADFVGHDVDLDNKVDYADYDTDSDGEFDKRMYDDDNDGWLDRTVRRRHRS
jgi:hypothetical protein